MEMLKNIDDRLLMTLLTVAVLAAYVVTRDAILGETLKYSFAALFGVMVARMQKTLTVADPETARTVAREFLGR